MQCADFLTILARLLMRILLLFSFVILSIPSAFSSDGFVYLADTHLVT
jgi:hypothetical protein